MHTPPLKNSPHVHPHVTEVPLLSWSKPWHRQVLGALVEHALGLVTLPNFPTLSRMTSYAMSASLRLMPPSHMTMLQMIQLKRVVHKCFSAVLLCKFN